MNMTLIFVLLIIAENLLMTMPEKKFNFTNSQRTTNSFDPSLLMLKNGFRISLLERRDKSPSVKVKAKAVGRPVGDVCKRMGKPIYG